MSLPARLRRPFVPRTALALALAGALLVLAVPAPAMAAGDATLAERYADLGDPDIATRRQAANWLGAHGTMASVPPLVAALRDEDTGVRVLAENSLWQIWMRSGDERVDALLARGHQALQAGRFREAVAIFDEVVRRDGEFAEGYNKRATALYYLGDYEGSLADIDRVLKRNEHHFGALSGAGLCLLGLERPVQALHYFERALKINPNMPGVVEMVQKLRQSEEGRML